MNKLLRFGLGLAIPPVGVFLTYGFSPALLINLPLTFLGWLPGSIHAVWAIAKHYEKEAEKQNETGTSLQPTEDVSQTEAIEPVA